MRKSKFSEEQIIGFLKQAEAGMPVAVVCRKREFLDELEHVVPWAALVQVVEPYYPRAKTGRPPFGIEPMLRIRYLLQWFALSGYTQAGYRLRKKNTAQIVTLFALSNVWMARRQLMGAVG